MPVNSLRMLNLGCGRSYRTDWVNIDFFPASRKIAGYDLNLGVPFLDDSFDIVYHSHVLEHFQPDYAERFMRECHRVLKPGGILRIAVPDLENIVLDYVKTLAECRENKSGAHDRRRWMLIELVDQLARRKSGGLMGRYFTRRPVPEEKFVRYRMGAEVDCIMAGFPPTTALPELLLAPVLDAQFMNSGELHQWMYDEFELKDLLEKVGFSTIEPKQFNESGSPEILQSSLDSAPGGSMPRKPDSLYCEATKNKTSCRHDFKVAMLSERDHGGAGIAGLRLHMGLRAQGVNSIFYTLRRRTTIEGVHVMPQYGKPVVVLGEHNEIAVQSALQEVQDSAQRLSVYPNRPCSGEFEHFSVPAGACRLKEMPCANDFDIFHLHWLENLFSPTTEPEALKGRPVVWTLHDMNPFTGGCHYSTGCTKFTESCGECPQLGSDIAQDQSRLTLLERLTAYKELDLHIVAPSKWLADEAKKSTLFKKFPVHVIPYAQPIADPLPIFTPGDVSSLRAKYGMKDTELVLTFASEALGNQRKGLHFILAALRELMLNQQAEGISLVLLGGAPAKEFLQLGMPVYAPGHLDNPADMAEIYSLSDAVLVPSREDNLPNVICEAVACGCPLIAFANGGIPEMIEHRKTGWLGSANSKQDLIDGINWVKVKRHDPELRNRCRTLALERWHPVTRSNDYISLYKDILSRKKN